MRFGIDLDGCIANFTASVVAIGNSLWPGKFPPSYVPENWNYEGYLTDVEWAQIWTVIKDTPYFWENETEMDGVAQLRNGITLPDEVFFITARATTKGEPPAVQSARWLHHRHLWPRAGYSTVLQVEEPKNKQDLFRALKIKFMLDDYAPTVQQLNQIEIDGEPVRAFVLDQPWNRYATELPRVFSVTEYLNKIRAL